MATESAQHTSDVEAGYDAVAEEYVRRIYDELRHKPLDRQVLDRFAQRVGGVGEVCDMGCGPGHVARYLHDRGVKVCGLDLSPGMLLHARQLNPGIEFVQGNMLALDIADGAWAGIAAFYCICNLPPSDLPATFREMHRVLAPGGLLLLSFHLGDEIKHLDEWWGFTVSLDFYFFRTSQITATLVDAGFTVEEIIERDPYPDVEHQSRRAYILCRA
jgi:SAM-dependent methyltransferase